MYHQFLDHVLSHEKQYVFSPRSKWYFTLLFFSIIIVAASEALGDWMNLDGSFRTAHIIVKCIEFSLMLCLPVFMAIGRCKTAPALNVYGRGIR